jgi:uncharacterized protein YigE (DUF2233 family)
MAAIRFKNAALVAIGVALLVGAVLLLWPRAGRQQGAGDAQAGASACEVIIFEGSRFTACRYRRGEDRIELILDAENQPIRSFASLQRFLGDRADTLRFAMNAGMFDESGKPIGLYVEHGRERRALNRRDGPGNFHLMPNGVFTIDNVGQVAVVRSDAYRARPEIVFATQSGPMMVIDGALHPRISDNGASLNIRNGVGVSAPDTAWFAISEEPVSFGRFARFFRDRLGCPNALFLDGTVSSLWDRPAERQDPNPALGPMVMVFRD